MHFGAKIQSNLPKNSFLAQKLDFTHSEKGAPRNYSLMHIVNYRWRHLPYWSDALYNTLMLKSWALLMFWTPERISVLCSVLPWRGKFLLDSSSPTAGFSVSFSPPHAWHYPSPLLVPCLIGTLGLALGGQTWQFWDANLTSSTEWKTKIEIDFYCSAKTSRQNNASICQMYQFLRHVFAFPPFWPSLDHLLSSLFGAL